MIDYILIPVFVLFLVVYKVWHKTKWVKLEEMDVWMGRRELTDEEIRPRKEKEMGRWVGRLKDVFVG